MGLVIVILGVIGLCVALGAVVEVVIDAGRKRQFIDIGIVLIVVALTVWLLIAYGDVLLQ